MLIENKIYRLIRFAGEWKCQEVTQAESVTDMQFCMSAGIAYRFTIRRFQSGVTFLLYSPHASDEQLNRMADRMASIPGR